MVYLRHEDDKMVKYDVEYDLEKLDVLRYEIINLCGKREYVSYETDYPNAQDHLLRENYREYPVGEKEYFEETRIVYRVEYNLIHEPILSILIRDFIQDNDPALLEYILENKTFKNEVIKNDKKKKLLRELKKSINDNIDYDKVRSILDEMEKIPDIDNSNLEDQNKYFESVKEAIKLTKVDEVDYDAFNKAMEFVKIIKK